MPPPKYARRERERRFLLDGIRADARVMRIRRISDRYIDGTSLRLRKLTEEGSPTIYKLTQKTAARAAGAQQGFITNIYVTQPEFLILGRLPALLLEKTRLSVPPLGIDVFSGHLEGLLLAEAEFDSSEAAEAFPIPDFLRAEVTADDRFTGGRLVRASRSELQGWLGEYGISLR